MKTQFRQLTAQRNNLQADFDALEKDSTNTIKKNLDEIKKSNDKLEQQYKEITRLTTLMKTLESEKQNLQKKLRELNSSSHEDASHLRSQIDEKNNEIQRLKDSLSLLKRRNQDSLQRMKELSKENLKFKGQIKAYQNRISALEEDFKKYTINSEKQQEIERLKYENKTLENQIQLERERQSNMQRKINESREREEELYAEIDRLKEELEENDSEKLNEDLRQAQTDLYNVRVEFQKLIKQKERVDFILKDAEFEFLKKEDEIESLQNKISILENNVDENIKYLTKVNVSLSEKIQELQTGIEKNIKDYQNRMEKAHLAEQDLSFSEQKIAEFATENKKLKKVIQDLEELLPTQPHTVESLKRELNLADKNYRALEAKVKSMPELTQLSEEEQRELRAINSMSIFEQNIPIETIIGSGEIEAEEWRNRAKKYGIATVKGKLCLDAAYRLAFQLDYFRNLKGEIPVTMEARQMLQEVINDSELARYTRFKIWAKENLLGLSALAITTAGLITTLAIGLKSGTTTVAKATWNLSKAFAHVAARVTAIAGPIVASAFSLLATILNWGARGIFFLANNLWLLGLLFLSALLSERKRRRARK